VSAGPEMILKPTRFFSKATRVLVTAMEETDVKRLICVTGFGAGDSRGYGWARRASARSHWVTGLDWLAASARNSALTHARRKTSPPSSTPGTAPSRPNSEGI